MNLQPFDPRHHRLITIRSLAPFSRCGPVTILTPIACLPVRAVLLAVRGRGAVAIHSGEQLLSLITSCASPRFVASVSP